MVVPGAGVGPRLAGECESDSCAERCPTGTFAHAEQLIAEERYREAIRFCQQELAASPRCVTLRLWLARAFLADGAGAKGVTELEECLRIDPTSAAAREMLQDLGVAVPSLPLPSLKPVAPKPHAARPAAQPTAARAVAAQPVAAQPVAARAVAAQPVAVARVKPQAAAQPAAVARVRPPVAAQPAPARPSTVTHQRAAIVYEPPPRRPPAPPPLRASPEPARATYEPPVATPPHVVFPPSPRVIYSAPSLPEPVGVQPMPKPAPLPLYEPPLPTFAPPPAVAPPRVAHDSPAKAAKARRSASRRRQAFDSSSFIHDESKSSPAAPGWQRPLAAAAHTPDRRARVAVVALALVAGALAWRLYREDRAPLPVAAVAASRPTPEPPVVKVDAPTLDAVGGDVWIHPLAGPDRRMPERDSRLFGAERTGDRPSECRGGHCGVDLAGAYGEPVFAVHDGIVEFVQRGANPDHGGRFVRLTHRNGTIATQYFHLSQVPSRIAEGVAVKAGDIVGFVGLTGVKRSEPHLHFTIEVQDPSGMQGRFLDPEPLVALWPLRVSPKGDPLRVSSVTAPGLARGFLRRRHRTHSEGE